MKFRRYSQIEPGLKQIDIIPLLSVIFLLFMFFMFTLSLVMPGGVKIGLPKALSGTTAYAGNLVIVVSAENIVYFNNEVVTMPELKVRLKKFKDNPVLIKSDKRASLGGLADIWAACRDAGISNITIATN